jgi:hypothetical protein
VVDGEGGSVELVVVEWRDGALMHDPYPYLDKLPELSPRLPVGARAFACDPEHYDFTGPRCVKDLEYGALSLGGEPFGLELHLEANPWKHSERLVIRYAGVTGVRVEVNPKAGLSSLRLDEILPHEHGCSHELLFLTGTVHVICSDLQARWEPAGDAPGGPGPRTEAPA